MDNIQITKERVSNIASSERIKIINALRLLKKGHCMKYRGSYPVRCVRALVSQGAAFLDKKLSGRAVEGGIDIFCE